MRIADPGPNTPSGGTTIRMSFGVRSAESPSTRTGAISRREPVWLGLATSTTQPSTKTMPRPAGAMGAAARLLCILPAASPHTAVANKAAAMPATRLGVNRRTARATTTAITAAV